MRNGHRIVFFALIGLGSTVAARASADGGPSSTMLENQVLFPGQGLVSDQCSYHLDMQTDGNLVEYGTENLASDPTEDPATAVWSSQEETVPGFNILSSPTDGLVPGSFFVFGSDGNFVWYGSPSLDAFWATGTNRGETNHLWMQDDGNLVIYDSGNLALWSQRALSTGPGPSPCFLTSHVTRLMPNINLNGQNLSNQCTNEYMQCGEWCAANQACLSWTWTPPGDSGSCSGSMGQCWLKDTLGTGGGTDAPTMVSGVIESYTPGIGNVTPGMAAWPPHSQLIGQGSDLCLGTVNEGTAMGSRVEIEACTDTPTQVWTLNEAGELQQAASGLCLNVVGGATSEGSLLQLWTCSGTPNELWNLSLNGELEGAGSGLCLNVVGGATAVGTPVQIWSCAGTTPNEVWSARPSWPAQSQITDASGLCLDTVDGETGEGSRVEIQTCNDTSLTQVWSLNYAGELQQQASGLCLNVIGGATSEGSLLQLWSCTGTPNELWSINQSSQLVGAGSGLCLYPVGGTTTAGTAVQIWSCAGDPASEIWTAQQTGELKGQGSGLCLNVDNGDTSEGSSLIIYSCAGSTPNEVWTLNAEQEVVGMGSGMCLDVVGGQTGQGSAADIWPCNGASSQQWALTPQGQLQEANSGLCLNVIGGATQSGTGLQIWPCNDTPNEVWTFDTAAAPNGQIVGGGLSGGIFGGGGGFNGGGSSFSGGLSGTGISG